jgi:hypothetical protein
MLEFKVSFIPAGTGDRKKRHESMEIPMKTVNLPARLEILKMRNYCLYEAGDYSGRFRQMVTRKYSMSKEFPGC